MTKAVVVQAQGADIALAVSAARHALNLVREVGEVPVDIVVQGGAVAGMVSGHDTAAAVIEALRDTPNVQIKVCRNALRANHVQEDTVDPAFTVVPAGIAWIVQRQWERLGVRLVKLTQRRRRP